MRRGEPSRLSPLEREPGRTCLGCRHRRPRGELIRIVRSPDGAAIFDLEGRLPGRGAWVCPSPGCVDALAPGALGHVLRAPVRLGSPASRRRDLADALLRRVSNLLTMARRMRGVTFGPTAARAALKEDRAKLVLVAGDAPGDATASWVARAAPVAVRTGPDATPLGELFGRGPVEVATITVAGLAEALLEAIDRWRAFSTILCNNENSIKDGAPRGGVAAGGG